MSAVINDRITIVRVLKRVCSTRPHRGDRRNGSTQHAARNIQPPPPAWFGGNFDKLWNQPGASFAELSSRHSGMYGFVEAH
jgi:hypothetical protein